MEVNTAPGRSKVPLAHSIQSNDFVFRRGPTSSLQMTIYKMDCNPSPGKCFGFYLKWGSKDILLFPFCFLDWVSDYIWLLKFMWTKTLLFSLTKGLLMKWMLKGSNRLHRHVWEIEAFSRFPSFSSVTWDMKGEAFIYAIELFLMSS